MGNRNSWKKWKLRYLTSGWSDLNETWYIKESCVSDAPFSIWIGSGDIGLEGGKQKSWKTLRVERLGWNLMGRISTSYKYKIDIISTDLFSLRELGVVNLEKSKNWGIFNLRSGDQILTKFDISKELMSQSSYFKFRSDLLTLGGNRKSLKMLINVVDMWLM